MSELVIEVCELAKVENHPNGDFLDIVTVKGWECATTRGKFKVGDKVVYFPPDTILPPERVEEFGIAAYLKNVMENGVRRPGRVAACRLRTLPSFGYVHPAPEGATVGQDMMVYYGATKYEPPPPTAEGVNARNHPAFLKYRGPDHWNNYPDAFIEGETVVVTEKIHGRNCRAAYIHTGDGVYEFMAGSHNFSYREFGGDKRSIYWTGVDEQTMALLKELSAGQHNVMLYGEVFGAGMQDLKYGQDRPRFRAFDISIDGNYLDWEDFDGICVYHKVPTVPVLYVGPYSRAKILELTDGPTTICDPSVAGKFKGREGVVVKPIKERALRNGRLILKSVSADYLGRRGETTDHH